jgi:hypothetical protein
MVKMSDWTFVIKKRCDAMIDSEGFVHDPKLGKICTKTVGRKFVTRFACIDPQLSPRRYEGVSHTGRYEDEILLGTWNLGSVLLGLSSEGESPSECLSKMAEQARDLAAKAVRYAERIEKILESEPDSFAGKSV